MFLFPPQDRALDLLLLPVVSVALVLSGPVVCRSRNLVIVGRCDETELSGVHVFRAGEVLWFESGLIKVYNQYIQQQLNSY